MGIILRVHVGVRLPCMVISLNDNRNNFAVNCHQFIYLHKCNKKKNHVWKFSLFFLRKDLGGA